jgi:hypothetical protein
MTEKEAAHKLCEAVTSQIDARIVVVELSGVSAIGGCGFRMLVLLQRWARKQYPVPAVQSLRISPERTKTCQIGFYIPSFDEMMALLAYANSRYAIAA